MNLGMAIWGAMSGAETDLWDPISTNCCTCSSAEVRRCGGPDLDPNRLRRHTLLYAATMGVAWLLDVPALIGKRFGARVPATATIRASGTTRASARRCRCCANLLNLWERHRLGDMLDAALAEEAARKRVLAGTPSVTRR